GLALTSWRHRRFAIWLFAAGTMLAVGVHRLGDPSPAVSALVGDTESGLALALRSSTRALPMATLGLALGAGALVAAVRPRRSWVRMAVPVLVAGAAIANMPSLWRHDYVDPALARDEDPPEAWDQATDALDAGDDDYRVLELPGQEFGAYRWGYTVDQPLPGLTERAIVTRDLLPLGSPMAMDLLFALDDRFQEGIAEPGAIAPVSRLLGADTIWVPGDAAFDRFRTPRPEQSSAFYADTPPGLGEPMPYGEPVVNEPDIDMVDEQSVTDALVGRPVAPVELVPVEDPLPVVRTKTGLTLVAGSGDGIVDAAAAGLIDGTELLRYSADMGGGALRDAIGGADALVVTDSNRDRAHRWASSQDAVGFTESGGPGNDLLRVESADARLPVFTNADPDRSTIATQRGPVTAVATAYGEPFAYRPEHRAAMAIDGDTTTAWLVADRFDASGERIVLTTDAGIDHIRFVQPRFAQRQRHLTAIDVRIDDRPAQRIELGPDSMTRSGQRVAIDPTTEPTRVEISVVATESPVDVPGPALAAVGFAEIDVGLGATTEFVRPPVDLLRRLDDADDDTPISLVFTRLRHDPTDRFRADPERVLRREFPLGSARSFDIDVTARLDQRASDAALNDVLGIDAPTSDDRVAGVASAAAFAAVDGDPATSWISPFAYPGDHDISFDLGGTETIDEFTITQPDDDERFSTITQLTVRAGDEEVEAEVGPPDADGTSTVQLPRPVTGDTVAVRVTGFDGVVVSDRRYAEPVFLPVAVSEISVGPRVTLPETVALPCRDDLLRLDGDPIALRLSGDTAALLDGEPFDVSPCDTAALELDAGMHRLTGTPGAATGIQIDRTVLSTASARAGGETAGENLVRTTIISRTRTSLRAEIGPCPKGCWFVLGEGYNGAWTAQSVPTKRSRPRTADPGAPTDRGITSYLGPPTAVDGGFNGWYIEPTDDRVTVTTEWTAQSRASYGLIASAAFVTLAVALIVLDRRRAIGVTSAAIAVRPTMASWRARETRLRVAIGVALATAGAALFVKPLWALPVAAVGAVAILLCHSRVAAIAGVATAAFVGGSTAYSVWREDPFPNGAWLRTVEPLHLVGLLVVVLMFAASVLPDDADVTAEEDESPPG
ncbi:MAG: DUF3367 domain-containing protein, partial [Acidimicrobiia bacterium]|nr:DUF3367 domain-containing protein [Acidimicrobiia bacterium]